MRSCKIAPKDWSQVKRKEKILEKSMYFNGTGFEQQLQQQPLPLQHE